MAEDPSRGQSGGRGPATAPNATPASAAYLPLDHMDFRNGQPVTLQLKPGEDIVGFKDPVYGWMDHNGVTLGARVPLAWKPL